MADCYWSVTETKMTCVRCGKPIPKVVEGLRATCRRMGWGDMLAWLLDKLGFKRLTTCGCYARQARINRVEAQLRLWLDPRGVSNTCTEEVVFSEKQKRVYGFPVETIRVYEESYPETFKFHEGFC